MADLQQQVADGARPRPARVEVAEPSGPGDREPDPREVADHHLMAALGVKRLDKVMPAIESLLADRKTLMLVESELGVTEPEDVLSALEKRFNALILARRARDEAVSRMQESERSTAALMVQLGQLYAALGVETGVEALGAIERLMERERLAKAIREKAAEFGPLFTDPPGPLVLSLPQVPDGAVALITHDDDGNEARFERIPGSRTPYCWTRPALDNDGTWALLQILTTFDGDVTVEFAPPREPRVWPALKTSISDLPDIVEVHGQGTWKRRPGRTLFGQGSDSRTLAQLRELGDVREVIEL